MSRYFNLKLKILLCSLVLSFCVSHPLPPIPSFCLKLKVNCGLMVYFSFCFFDLLILMVPLGG